MSYLNKLRTYSAPFWLLVATGACVSNAAAQGWVLNPRASANTPANYADDSTKGTRSTNSSTEYTPTHNRRGSENQNKDEAPTLARDSKHKNADTNTERNKVENLEASRSVGNGVIYPIAKLSTGYRSDVYESDENGYIEEKGAANIAWGLGAGYQRSNRGHLSGVEYFIEGNEYISGDNDEDEVSHRLNGYWGTAFTSRSHLDLGIEYVDSYDPRGRGDSLRNIRPNTVGRESDRWNELTGGGIYSYGGERARGRLELSAYVGNREYDNNGQQYRNRDEVDLGAAAYFKIMAKTEFYAQVVYTDLDYVDQAQSDPTGGRSLDNEERRYMLGLKWYPSEKLSGTFRVGTTEKTFEPESGRTDYDEISWDSNIVWTPNNRNSFGLSYSRAPRESYVYFENQLLDDFVEIENLSLSWSHLWGQNFSTSLSYTIGEDSFLPSGRIDDRDEFSIGLAYSLPRWGSVGLTYFNRKRSSNVPGHDYDDDGVSIHFNLGSALGIGDGNTRAPGVRNQRQYQPGYAVY